MGERRSAVQWRAMGAGSVGWEKGLVDDVAALEREYAAYKDDCCQTHEDDNERCMALERELAELKAAIAASPDGRSTQVAMQTAISLGAELASVRGKLARIVEALGDYLCHHPECPLAQWHEGRPTKDGGYESRYGDKWYQGDDRPPCTCGLDAAVKEATDGE